jgi:hypothetical protein
MQIWKNIRRNRNYICLMCLIKFYPQFSNLNSDELLYRNIFNKYFFIIYSGKYIIACILLHITSPNKKKILFYFLQKSQKVRSCPDFRKSKNSVHFMPLDFGRKFCWTNFEQKLLNVDYFINVAIYRGCLSTNNSNRLWYTPHFNSSIS